MIVKSMPGKNKTFTDLATYISRAPASELATNLAHYITRDDASTAPAIVHNLRSKPDADPEVIAREFSENAALAPERKNGNEIYHEILAFAPEDAPVVTYKMLEDLTRKYLDMRAPDCLVYGKIHFDKPHIHVHLMISANPVGSRKRHWMTRDEFNKVKIRINDYQKHRWPELVHSVWKSEHDHSPAVVDPHLATDHIERFSDPVEQQTQRKEREQANRSYTKPELAALLEHVITTAQSEEHLQTLLGQHNLTLVLRGQSYSVKFGPTGRSYRLRSSGYQERFVAAIANWRQTEQAKSEMRDVIATRDRGEWRENTGFATRIMSIIAQVSQRTTSRMAELAKTMRQRIAKDTRER